MGLDLSPDGKTLYVANSTANSLSVVDVATAKETSRIPVPPGFSNDSPFSVAVSSAKNAFFSTTFAGSGFGGRMMEHDPATAILRQRTDFWFVHWTLAEPLLYELDRVPNQAGRRGCY